MADFVKIKILSYKYEFHKYATLLNINNENIKSWNIGPNIALSSNIF